MFFLQEVSFYSDCHKSNVKFYLKTRFNYNFYFKSWSSLFWVKLTVNCEVVKVVKRVIHCEKEWNKKKT